MSSKAPAVAGAGGPQPGGFPARGRRTAGRRWATAAVAVLGVGFLALFLHRLSWAQVSRAWAHLPLPVLLLAVLLQGAFLGLRAARFQAMARSRRGAGSWFAPVAAYSMTCTVFPGGSGELLLPVYLRPLGISAGTGIGLALGSRLLDVGWSAVLALGVAAWFLPDGARLPVVEGVLAAAGLLLAAAGLWATRARWQPGLAAHLHARPQLARFLSQAAAVFRGWGPAQLAGFSLLTLGMKASAAAFYYVLARGLGVPVGFTAVAAAMVLYSLFMVVPVQGVAGVGTSDAWWVLALSLVGVHLPSALLLALTFHLLNLAAVSIWSLAYWAGRLRPAVVAWRFSRGPDPEPPQAG
ncbi:MAG: lysylphosphatidylglycerol synthase domain-containing protein [Firmicutes bacterium]|nr:lysylphosphatidylglycerol synthase domain-containing protein [Bacillota bacterium]